MIPSYQTYLYNDFLAGKIRKSTTAKFKSGLTTTYDYFYSSSGMDDYPAQVAMMNRSLRDTAAPVISTSQVIRCAKILYITAKKTGSFLFMSLLLFRRFGLNGIGVLKQNFTVNGRVIASVKVIKLRFILIRIHMRKPVG